MTESPFWRIGDLHLPGDTPSSVTKRHDRFERVRQGENAELYQAGKCLYLAKTREALAELAAAITETPVAKSGDTEAALFLRDATHVAGYRLRALGDPRVAHVVEHFGQRVLLGVSG